MNNVEFKTQLLWLLTTDEILLKKLRHFNKDGYFTEHHQVVFDKIIEYHEGYR